ncbi:MAG: helix-turn-helix domain-containing protein [Christensenellales bacterium]|jgi:transcriptional regulator with XRE-family HTH domain
MLKLIGQRLLMLRESVGFSQKKIAKLFGVGQSSIYRYESGEASAPYHVLIQYADFFDVSLDYIYGRTDAPQGKLYEGKAKINISNPEMEKFIEMCFDPKSPMNKRLKDTLRQMFKEGN